MGCPTKKCWRCTWGRHLHLLLVILQSWSDDSKYISSLALSFLFQLFKNYCLGKLKSNPWSELDGLQPETTIINEHLGNINMKGFLTINSQPAVNGERSDSPTVGRSPLSLYLLTPLPKPLFSMAHFYGECPLFYSPIPDVTCYIFFLFCLFALCIGSGSNAWIWLLVWCPPVFFLC